MVVLGGATLAIVLNRVWIYDFWRGMGYEPSVEMGRIRDRLGLTERGEFLFRAVWPELDGREEFNEKCRSEADMGVAVLGCYTEGKVYVYDIVDEELEGIRELTTAHELLHAVWERMREDERKELIESLMRVFEANQEALEEELGVYGISEREEELYVRAGTEIRGLSADLEKHYEEVFKNRDKIVNYYEGYIGVFRRIETEMEELENEVEKVGVEIETKTAEYELKVGQLDAEAISFNSCAEIAGCFKSEEEFRLRREELIMEQEALIEMYDELNRLIDRYNELVDKYNTDVTHVRRLNNVVNSNERPEGI